MRSNVKGSRETDPMYYGLHCRPCWSSLLIKRQACRRNHKLLERLHYIAMAFCTAVAHCDRDATLGMDGIWQDGMIWDRTDPRAKDQQDRKPLSLLKLISSAPATISIFLLSRIILNYPCYCLTSRYSFPHSLSLLDTPTCALQSGLETPFFQGSRLTVN